MSDKSALLRCPACGKKNRAPIAKLLNGPRCGACGDPIPVPDRPVSVTARDWDAEVLGWPGLALVDFWAPWCGPCRALAPTLEALAMERRGLLKVVKANTEESPDLAARFGIRSIPTLHLYRDGRLLDQTSGALPKAQLEAWIDGR